MKVLVDYREKHLAKLLNNIFQEIVLTKLPVGDYFLTIDLEATIIERKSIADFWSSIRTNRLWDQLLRLMKTENMLGYQIKRKIFLIHGSFKDYFELLYESEIDQIRRWSQLMGAYQEIIYVYNIPIIYAENDIAFKAFMKILGKREENRKNDKYPEARWYMKVAPANLPVEDRKKYILSSFPYIGNKLAENLLIQFNTISEISCASVEELKKVPKIGKKKANLIYMLFHS